MASTDSEKSSKRIRREQETPGEDKQHDIKVRCGSRNGASQNRKAVGEDSGHTNNSKVQLLMCK